MSGLRVGLVSTAPLSDVGSMRSYAAVLVDALSRHAGHLEPEVIELQPGGVKGVWGRRLETLRLPLRARKVAAQAPDLWHVLDGSRAHVALELRTAPVVITVHDVIPWLQGAGLMSGCPPLSSAARLLWRQNGRAFRASEALLCDSRCTASDVQQHFSASVERCHVVPLPIRPGLLGYRNGHVGLRQEGCVLHVGGNGFYKNRAGVLRIFSRMDPSVAHRLVMVGPEPPRELRAFAESAGIGARVEWLTDVSESGLASCYSQASVFLFPSVYEGFGWPPLEAMGFGVPVVASDRGSLPEVVAGAGICLPLEEEAAFAAAVETLLRSPTARREAAQRGLERAAQFSLTRLADGVTRAYKAALENASGRAVR